jgi:hypothetical protein
VQNWVVLQKRFIAVSDGDDVLLDKVFDINNEVISYNLGNKNNPLDDTEKYVHFSPFLSEIGLAELALDGAEIRLRDREIDRIINLEVEDFKDMLAFLRKASALEAQTIGLGDQDAADLLGISVAPKRRSATIQDLETIQYQDQLYHVIEDIVFELLTTRKRPPNLLTTAANDIDPLSQVTIIPDFVSYTLHPFEISLEHMAKKFLGDNRLWYELVTVNNLQPPFVDEAGTKMPLLAPAAVNNLLISSSIQTDLAVGSKISIGSHSVREETRVVERLVVNENGSMIVFLSGVQDLNKLKPSEEAFLRVYKPGTVRKDSLIKIPSTTAAARNRSLVTPSSDELRRIDQNLLNFGVDIAVDAINGDLVIDPNGNFKMAYGFENIRQTVLHALKTTRGELPFHPKYGVNLRLGEKFYGTLDEATLFSQLLIDTILKDPRFLDVKIKGLAATGNSISLSILVTVSGVSHAIPLDFIV